MTDLGIEMMPKVADSTEVADSVRLLFEKADSLECSVGKDAYWARAEYGRYALGVFCRFGRRERGLFRAINLDGRIADIQVQDLDSPKTPHSKKVRGQLAVVPLPFFESRVRRQVRYAQEIAYIANKISQEYHLELDTLSLEQVDSESSRPGEVVGAEAFAV